MPDLIVSRPSSPRRGAGSGLPWAFPHTKTPQKRLSPSHLVRLEGYSAMRAKRSIHIFLSKHFSMYYDYRTPIEGYLGR